MVQLKVNVWGFQKLGFFFALDGPNNPPRPASESKLTQLLVRTIPWKG